MNGLDLDHRLQRALVSVVAGELAERAFELGIAGMEQSLDHQLGVSRDRQADMLRRGQLDRPAHDAAGDLELRFAAPKTCAPTMNSTGSTP